MTEYQINKLKSAYTLIYTHTYNYLEDTVEEKILLTMAETPKTKDKIQR